MAAIPVLKEAAIKSIAELLGDSVTGRVISDVLEDREIVDNSGEGTKWKRLYWVFQKLQKTYQCSNKVLDIVQSILAPARFVENPDNFEHYRNKLNVIMSLSGLEYGKDGQFRHSRYASTLDEATMRVKIIEQKFKGRRLHNEVDKYCLAELMQENYFHAVFEATKGLAQRIRDMSGIELDGATLVDEVFSMKKPLLALNSLRTETEKSEHKGFELLLKGCFGAIRNPLAHGPKILWEGEDDAADYLTLISLLHRKLDSCVTTGIQQ